MGSKGGWNCCRGFQFIRFGEPAKGKGRIMGCGEVGGIAQVEDLQRVGVNLKTPDANVQDIVVHRLRIGSQPGVEECVDRGRFGLVRWRTGIGSGKAEHGLANENRFAQAGIDVQTSIDFDGRKNHRDTGCG